MAQQEEEEGWPLGLQPLNARAGLVRHPDRAGSDSFNTILTTSLSSSSLSSSDLDTQSTGSFFHDKSMTLGSLIGISNILEFSRRSIRRRSAETVKHSTKKHESSKTWCFSLCSRLTTDAVIMNHTPSLGHFLEAERNVSIRHRRSQSPVIYGPDDFTQVLHVSDTNSLFVGDEIAPPAHQSSTWLASEGSVHGVPLLSSCLCGQLNH